MIIITKWKRVDVASLCLLMLMLALGGMTYASTELVVLDEVQLFGDTTTMNDALSEVMLIWVVVVTIIVVTITIWIGLKSLYLDRNVDYEDDDFARGYNRMVSRRRHIDAYRSLSRGRGINVSDIRPEVRNTTKSATKNIDNEYYY